MSADTRKNPRPAAVLIGLDSLPGIQAARILARRQVPVIAVAKDPRHPYCRTRICRQVLTADTGTGECIDLLEGLQRRLDSRGVLFPCDDASVLLLSRHRQRLAGGYHVVLPAPEVVEMLLDKVRFYAYARENGLPIPATVVLRGRNDVRRAEAEIGFPCLVKPGRRNSQWLYHVETKAFKVFSRQELENVCDQYGPYADMLLAQAWIGGPDADLYSCNCYFNAASEPLVAFTARKLRQWPPHLGVSSLGEECRADVTRRQAIGLFRSVRFRGLGYLEMKHERSSGRHFIMEPNIGRPTGRSAIAEAGGVELLYTMYCDAAGLPIPEARQQRYRGVKWIHLRQDLQSALYYWRRGDLGLKDILRSWRGPKAYAVFSWRDPVPFLADVARIVGRLLSERGRNHWKRINKALSGSGGGHSRRRPAV